MEPTPNLIDLKAVFNQSDDPINYYRFAVCETKNGVVMVVAGHLTKV